MRFLDIDMGNWGHCATSVRPGSKQFDIDLTDRQGTGIMIGLSAIYHYPVKSLSGQSLQMADLSAGAGLPHDRQYALAPGTLQTDGTTSDWIPKNNFLVLQKYERLAALETVFDPDTHVLTINRGGRQVARGDLRTKIGCSLIEDFFMAFMGPETMTKRGPRIKIIRATVDQSLEDQPRRLLSIINLATVRDIERVVGSEINPRRFRGNLYVDTGIPWQEFSWLGRELTIGNARLRIVARTGRCAATHVNPTTARRDINLLKSLQQNFSHTDCGIFAEVACNGRIAVGEPLGVP